MKLDPRDENFRDVLRNRGLLSCDEGLDNVCRRRAGESANSLVRARRRLRINPRSRDEAVGNTLSEE